MPETLRRRIRRKEDGLWLDFEFHGFEFETGRSPSLRPTGRSGLVSVHFPPQHVVEATGPHAPHGTRPTPIEARLAGPSRLVFRVTTPIRLSLKGLLDWKEWKPYLQRNASDPGDSLGTTDWPPPTLEETALEMPTGLVMSPGSSATWRHSSVGLPSPSSQQVGGGYELWQTRLVEKDSGRIAKPEAELRAVYANPAEAVTDAPVTSAVAQDLLRLTSMWPSAAGAAKPSPVRGSLSLGMLGASAQLKGDWPGVHENEDGQRIHLNAWHHVASLGRDQFVRIVQEGFLCPTGHRACKVEVFERNACGYPNLTTNWASIQRFHSVVILERTIDYSNMRDRFPYKGRECPFARIEILVDATPHLVNPVSRIFVPSIVKPDGRQGTVTPFEFPMQGWGHNTPSGVPPVRFSTELHFVPDPQDWLHRRQDFKVSLALHDQRLRFVETHNPKSSSVLFVSSLDLSATDAVDGHAGQTPFLPVMTSTTVRVPAIAALTAPSTPLTMKWADSYLMNGLSAGNSIFLERNDQGSSSLAFIGASGGGVAAPRFRFDALGSDRGPTVKNFPGTLFEDTKLLGVLPLSDLVANEQPSITEDENGAAPSFFWEMDLKSNVTLGLLRFRGDRPTLRLDVTRKEEDSLSIDGRINNFTLTFADIVDLKFSRLRFSMERGHKADVTIEGLVPALAGPLGFFSELARKVEALKLFDKNGPSIEVGADGVVASYALALPDLELGIFSVQSIRLGTHVSLPFSGRPAAATFSFGERHAPFLVTASLIGGGGFLALTATTKGIERVEGALEFGGNIALDLGVAEAAVSVMAGTYFCLEHSQDRVVFSGYYRANGAVEVFGLVGVTIQFYIGLSCPDHKESGEPFVIFGEASVSFSVKIGFVSKSVCLHVQRRLEGPDPTFKDAMSLAAWRSYCRAFEG